MDQNSEPLSDPLDRQEKIEKEERPHNDEDESSQSDPEDRNHNLHDIARDVNEGDDEVLVDMDEDVLQEPDEKRQGDENGDENGENGAENPTNPYYERVKIIFNALRQFTKLAYPTEKKHKFNPRLTRSELIQLQEYLGYTVPDDFLSIYSRHNGHDPDHPIQYVYGGEFLSTQRIIEEVEKWRQYSATLTEETDPCREHPKDRLHGVKQSSWNDLWLPFMVSEDKGEYLCLDLDPNRACGGTSGQIICVSWYSTPRYWVTTDILYFFELLTEKLLHGDISLTNKNEEATGLGYYCSLM